MILNFKLRNHGFFFEASIVASRDLGWGGEFGLRFILSPSARSISIDKRRYSQPWETIVGFHDPLTDLDFLSHLFWVTRSERFIRWLAADDILFDWDNDMYWLIDDEDNLF